LALILALFKRGGAPYPGSFGPPLNRLLS
jgi:hypothetical protein